MRYARENPKNCQTQQERSAMITMTDALKEAQSVVEKAEWNFLPLFGKKPEKGVWRHQWQTCAQDDGSRLEGRITEELRDGDKRPTYNVTLALLESVDDDVRMTRIMRRECISGWVNDAFFVLQEAVTKWQIENYAQMLIDASEISESEMLETASAEAKVSADASAERRQGQGKSRWQRALRGRWRQNYKDKEIE